MSKKQKSQLHAKLGKLSWANRTPEQRERHREACRAARLRLPKRRRKELASMAAAAISPEAAHERQIKAAATRKRNLAKRQRGKNHATAV